jgi:hypothetical protein
MDMGAVKGGVTASASGGLDEIACQTAADATDVLLVEVAMTK